MRMLALPPWPTPATVILLAVVASLSFAGDAAAQRAVARDDAHPKARQAYETGVQAAFKGDAKHAVRYLEAAIKREPHFADALVELAGVYYNAGNYARAEDYLRRVAAFEGRAGLRARYGLAMAQLKLGDYAAAADNLAAYLTDPELRADRRVAAERYLADAEFRGEALANPVAITLEPLPPTVNSAAEAEYLPALTADGRTLVFTRRVGGRDEDFYESTFDPEAGTWAPARPIDAINTPDAEGAQTISADGKLLVFTGCDRRGGLGSCDLYYANRRPDGGWSEPRNLGAPVNTAAWESQPSLSANGDLLFFASTRPGGRGKADLYAAGRTPGGGWGEPINLGPAVNTDGDETTPFFHADGRTLYFMSDRHPGMGNFDLFLTRLGDDGTWAAPENLGYPLNTAANEGSLVVALDGQTAYYATDAAAADRDGADSISVGGGRRAGTTDLFTFTLPPAARAGVVTYLRARVVDAVTEAPVAALAVVSDVADDRPVVKRRAAATDGTLLAVLPSGKTYALTVEEPGYAFYSGRFELEDPTDAERPFELTVRLQPLRPTAVAADDAAAAPTSPAREPIALRNVLFATGSAELLGESRAELDRLARLLADNPALRIRIQGHTDDVGDDADNQTLSERRAASVRDYLIDEGGIAADRLESRGFGESLPLEPNVDAASRAVNRRTEFLIL